MIDENSQDALLFRVNLGARIAQCVEIIGRKSDAALVVGVSSEQLNKWIKGSVKVPVEALRLLAQAANSDFSWLATGVGFPDHGRPVQIRRGHGRPTQSAPPPSAPDMQRLTAAIEAVDEGLSGRQVPARVKAELTIAAYDLLIEATAENRARVIRLVKGG